MSLLNVESYVFINVFYLALFCIHVCIDDVIKKKKDMSKFDFCWLQQKTLLLKKVASQAV